MANRVQSSCWNWARMRLERHDEDALAPAPLDQLRQQDADFERLADADAVEDADAGPQRRQRPVGRDKLVPGEVQRRLVAEVDLVVGGRGAPQQAFEVEPGAAVLRAGVGHEVGVLGPHLGDVVEGGEERPLLVADEFGHADDPDGVPAGGDGHGRADEPLLVPDDDTGTGRSTASMVMVKHLLPPRLAQSRNISRAFST